MNPHLLETLLDVKARADQAGHGGKGAVYDDACKRLACSRATLMRQLKEISMKPERKRRSDAGKVLLPEHEARLISAHMMEGYRANDKKVVTVVKALQVLRANGKIRAEAVDADGVIRLLSAGAVSRALYHYKLHPKQLRRPPPAQPQASLHPNDVWLIDASISTLFYVPEGGLADMSPAEFYKNKPGNFEKIKRQRLTRYVITDHCSGAIFVHYVAGGESIVNLTESILAAFAQRPGQQMYGVPFYLVMDPGSGDTSAFKTFLRRLLIEPVVNGVGNPRAKGQVEGAHNIVECDFESGFKFTHVPDIAWINAQAGRWMRWYNSTKVHSRHGLTRYAKWMEITQEQLRLVDVELARKLITKKAEERTVDQWLQVQFDGRSWWVKNVPGVMVGEKLMVTFNAFRQDAAFVVTSALDGTEQLIEIDLVREGEHHFVEGAALIGREFKSIPDTVADTHRKLVERIATGTDTDTAAKASRRSKALPFAGLVDPYKHHDDVPDVVTLPRRGSDLAVTTQTAAAPAQVLDHFKAAAELRRLGVEMNLEKNRQIAAWYPDGVPETEISSLAQRLTVRAGLRVVGGAL